MTNEIRGSLPMKVDATSNGEFRPVPLAEPVARANSEAERRIGERTPRRTWTTGIFTIPLRGSYHVAHIE